MRRGGARSGQTLIVFALMMAFVFLGLLALVGNSAVLMYGYEQASAEALVGAQAGASDVDLQQLYRFNVRALAADAATECQAAATQEPGTSASCTVSGGNRVTAVVTKQVRLPIPLVPVDATVTARHSAQAVFGGIAPQ